MNTHRFSSRFFTFFPIDLCTLGEDEDDELLRCDDSVDDEVADHSAAEVEAGELF